MTDVELEKHLGWVNLVAAKKVRDIFASSRENRNIYMIKNCPTVGHNRITITETQTIKGMNVQARGVRVKERSHALCVGIVRLLPRKFRPFPFKNVFLHIDNR